MHTGEFGRLSEAITFYNAAMALPGVDEIPGVGTYVFDLTGFDSYDLDAFLRFGLLDSPGRGRDVPFRPSPVTQRGGAVAQNRACAAAPIGMTVPFTATTPFS